MARKRKPAPKPAPHTRKGPLRLLPPKHPRCSTSPSSSSSSSCPKPAYLMRAWFAVVAASLVVALTSVQPFTTIGTTVVAFGKWGVMNILTHVWSAVCFCFSGFISLVVAVAGAVFSCAAVGALAALVLASPLAAAYSAYLALNWRRSFSVAYRASLLFRACCSLLFTRAYLKGDDYIPSAEHWNLATGLALFVGAATLIQTAIDRFLGNRLQARLLRIANKCTSEYEARMRPLLVRPVADLNLEFLRGEATTSGNVKLMRELRHMRQLLPVSAHASVFVRYDKAKPFHVQALISGPPGTPYDSGLFLFDVDCSGSYPDRAPFVNIRTTNGGRVRMNPNLYSNGKVCLSLLGTWSGQHASERWTKDSTLLQVFVSIQSLIMIRLPWYAEPGRGEMPKESSLSNFAPQGRVRTDTNGGLEHIREYNVLYAMADQIMKPPKGFEDVVRTHFAMKQAYIEGVVDTWLTDSSGAHHVRMVAARDKLRDAFKTLPPLAAMTEKAKATPAPGKSLPNDAAAQPPGFDEPTPATA